MALFTVSGPELAPMHPFPFRRSKQTDKPPHNYDSPKPAPGSISQRLRLYSGLVLMVFVTLHYINHGLGNISIEWMNAMHNWRSKFWQSPPGTVLLYGALVTHVVLVLWKIISRKTFRLPMWEWIQIILGLLIPYFLFTHIIAMRGPFEIMGLHIGYPLAFGMMWPGALIPQNILLFITWLHGCIGLHFWLRLNAWYTRYILIWTSFAVLLPTMALTGWVNAARQKAVEMQSLTLQSPEKAQQYYDTIRSVYSQIVPIIQISREGVLYAGAILLLILVAIQIALRFKKRIRIDYGDGRLITAVPGNSILEVSRQAGIPHMSVCGGRARCSTCRTLIIEGQENLTAKTSAELDLLTRLNAEDSIRLACQAKVTGNVKLRPLVLPHAQTSPSKSGDPLGWGVEREIAILFLDIRGFSKISERSLPYDVVFILNSFFGEVSSAVESNNGYVDKFMGDGMMALFGLNSTSSQASRDAICAAIDCVKAAQNVSRILTQHLAEPIKIGIGLHVGDAVIGRIGKTSDTDNLSRLTAIGDSVNISARLEQATKEFATPLVISGKIAEMAGLSNLEALGEETEIKVRNISRPVKIVAISDMAQLEAAL